MKTMFQTLPRRSVAGVLVAGLLLASLPARADTARDALKQFVDRVQTLSADFKQVQTDDKGAVVKSQTGHMWIKRPGRFRWDYDKPYKQTIVCDGDKIWVYDPDLQQVTVRAAKQALAGSPAALLSQRGALTDAFALSDEGSDAGAQKIRMTPKSKNSDFQSIELWLKDGVPVHMAFHDQLGDVTDVRFDNLQVNKSVAPDHFKFTVPKGVDVVGEGAPDTD